MNPAGQKPPCGEHCPANDGDIEMNANHVVIEDLDLTFSYNPVSFLDTYQERIGNQVICGYLTDSVAPMNPLEDWDGVGRIYTAHRHSSSHADMQEALGLDSNWEPDLDLVHGHPERFRKAWVLAAATDPEFQDWCHKNGRPPKYADQDRLDAYYKRKAKRFWKDTDGELGPDCYWMTTIWSFEITDSVLEKLWHELNSEGLIGDPDRVSLDVYEHSGVVYSVSGAGAGCAWDTTRGGAVWVPDDCARDEIDRRAPVYAYGEIVTKRSPAGKVWAFKLHQSPDITSIWFSSWGSAFNALETATQAKREKDQSTPDWDEMVRKGRRLAATELAAEGAQLYTDFCNGAVYEVVIETFELCSCCSAAKSISSERHEECFGSEDAEASLKESFLQEVIAATKRVESR